MKIRDSILLVLTLGIGVTCAVLIGFAASRLEDVEGATSNASSDALVVEANENLANIALGIRDSLDSQMQNQYRMVRGWAETPTLVEASRAALALPREAVFESWSAAAVRTFDEGEAVGDGNPANDVSPAASEYLANLAKTNPYPELFSTDSRGFVVAASGVTGDFDQGPDDWRFLEGKGFAQKSPEPGGEEWFRLAAESQRGLYVSPVSWDESSKSWGIEIISSIEDPKSRARLGELKAVFDYGRFVDRFVKTEELGVYEIKIVAGDGTIVATSLDAKQKVNSAALKVDDAAYFRDIRKGKLSGFVASPGEDENGETVYVGYAVSSDVNRHVVVASKKRADVEGPIDTFAASLRGSIRAAGREMKHDMTMVGAGVGAVMVFLAMVIMVRKISVPLEKLTLVSEKLSKGEIEGLRIDVAGNDEIGRFGESFKGVLAAFQTLVEEAEQKGK
jgi:hypothetical protein